jgi:hypothetical protein
VLWLLQAHSNGRETLIKDQIVRWAGSHLHVAMEDGAAGYTKWNSVKNMQAKNWVKRTAYSRYAVMPLGPPLHVLTIMSRNVWVSDLFDRDLLDRGLLPPIHAVLPALPG